MDAPLPRKGPLQGGKRLGCVEKHTAGYRVRFRTAKVKDKKYFGIREYGDLECARQAAEAWKIRVSDELGLTTNRYRRIDTNQEHYYEVELTDGAVMFVDHDALPLVAAHGWYRTSEGYAATSIGITNPSFHRLYLGPSTAGFEVDHMNRNRLDNRRSNLRIVTSRVNQNNMSRYKNNTSGTTGVSYDKIRKRWGAHWYENGKMKLKLFSVALYGEEEARHLADVTRKEAARRLGNYNGLKPPTEPAISQ